jgi:hypothetical protein
MPYDDENTVGTYPLRQIRPRESPEQEKAISHLKRAKEAVRKLRDDSKFEALKGKSNYRHWADNMEQLFDDNAVTPIVYGEVMFLPASIATSWRKLNLSHSREELSIAMCRSKFNNISKIESFVIRLLCGE